MKTIKIFGYGSLINEKYLKKTCPNAKILFSAKLNGFIRVFNIKSTNRGDIAVLNIEKSEWNEFVNGVCFEIAFDEMDCLKEREKSYELVQVEISEYENEKNVHKAFVWRARHFDTYDYQESEDQKKYLNICLEGAKNFGDKFLEDFKKTTYVGEETLEKIEL